MVINAMNLPLEVRAQVHKELMAIKIGHVFHQNYLTIYLSNMKAYGDIRCNKCDKNITNEAKYHDRALGVTFCGDCNASYD